MNKQVITQQIKQKAFELGFSFVGISKATFLEQEARRLEDWLKDNGFNYHGLLMGKPRGGNYHWIDNHIVRATRFTGKFTNLVEKSANIQVFKE